MRSPISVFKVGSPEPEKVMKSIRTPELIFFLISTRTSLAGIKACLEKVVLGPCPS